MQLLLDTHTFIWFVLDSARLNPSTKQLIEDDNKKCTPLLVGMKFLIVMQFKDYGEFNCSI